MGLTSTTNRVSYTGAGDQSVYAYPFRILEDSDLRVTVRDTDGLETRLTLTTHYTVSGATDLTGGDVTLVNGGFAWQDSGGDLLDDYVLLIRRVMPLTQETDIRNQGDFYPEAHEDEFDRGVMVSQQQQDELDRCVKLPETIISSTFDPTLPTDIAQAGQFLKTNSLGTGWTVTTDGATSDDTESDFTLANNQVSAASITNLLPAVALRGFVVEADIKRSTATVSSEVREHVLLYIGYRSETTSWEILGEQRFGDFSGIIFSIVSGTGQLQYTSTSISGSSYSGSLKWRTRSYNA